MADIDDTSIDFNEDTVLPPEEKNKSAREIITAANQNVTKYTVDQRVQAVLVYFVKQSRSKTAQIVNVPEGTIKHWMQTVWWKQAYESLKKQKNEELDGKITGILTTSIDLLAKRLKKGDEVITKDGQTIYKAVTARDVAMIAAILFDKRAILRGESSSKTDRTSTKEVLTELMASFKQLAEEARPKKEKVINAVPVEAIAEFSVEVPATRG